jgi:hypothetical protein
MRIGGVQTALLVIAVLIVPLLFQWPLAAYVTRPENQQLTELLSDASNEALELANDAADMQLLIANDKNWVTHALKLASVKAHVDNMALIIDKLTKAQKSGCELQEQAVQQMLPLVKELSANTTAAINYLNRNKTRPISDSYTQYVNKNAETARQLSSIIMSLLEYQKGMADIDKLRSKLVASGASTP